MSNWDLSKDRFEVVYKQSKMLNDYRIVVDRETGVQYMQASIAGQAGGLTVLLDKEGKPLLWKA